MVEHSLFSEDFIDHKEETKVRTMTNAQMAWNLKKGFAWYELDANGEPNDHWHMPIWTKDGGWVWDVDSQRYELVI